MHAARHLSSPNAHSATLVDGVLDILIGKWFSPEQILIIFHAESYSQAHALLRKYEKENNMPLSALERETVDMLLVQEITAKTIEQIHRAG